MLFHLAMSSEFRNFEVVNFPSLGVIPYNNRTLSRLQVSDCANKFMGLKF